MQILDSSLQFKASRTGLSLGSLWLGEANTVAQGVCQAASGIPASSPTLVGLLCGFSLLTPCSPLLACLGITVPSPKWSLVQASQEAQGSSGTQAPRGSLCRQVGPHASVRTQGNDFHPNSNCAAADLGAALQSNTRRNIRNWVPSVP